jgi:tripeptide aminopeptidase
MSGSADSRLVEIFLDLVRIDGLSGREGGVADYVRIFLCGLGLEPREDGAGAATGGETGNLVCRVGSGGDIILLSHMDTARPTRDVVPVVSGGRITSDGSTILGADNRAGVAVLLFAAEQVARAGTAADFTLGFTIREEDDLAGSRLIELPDGVRMGITFDSSLRPGNVIREAFGAMRFQVRIGGRAAHSGLAPERGVSAIRIASEIVAGLGLGRLDAQTTANVGRISGGSALNVVPEQAGFEGEVRSLDETRIVSWIESLRAATESACDSHGAEGTVECAWDFRPFRVPQDSEVFARTRSAIQRAGLEAAASTSAGGSDANSLNARGLPTLNLGIGAENPHANDEFIRIEDLRAAAAIARGLMSHH